MGHQVPVRHQMFAYRLGHSLHALGMTLHLPKIHWTWMLLCVTCMQAWQLLSPKPCPHAYTITPEETGGRMDMSCV